MSEDLGKEIPGAVGPRLGEELVRGAVLDDLAIGHERDTVGGVAAKPISCETTIIVMPSSARRVMTSSTSETISGSSAEVGSSKSMSLGCIARARAMAARCCWPPDNWAGYLSAWLWIPSRPSRSMACASACAFGVLRTLTGPSVTFCRTVLCANRLNDWNTMPTSARCRASSRPSAGSGLPVEEDASRVNGLEPVDRSAQGRLAAARGTHDDQDFAAFQAQADGPQDLQVPEALADVFQGQERLGAPRTGRPGRGAAVRHGAGRDAAAR